MNIAFIINQEVIPSGKYNGIRQQALIWKDAIESKGHQVTLLSPWKYSNIRDFDVIHIFGKDSVLKLLPAIYKANTRIVLSPIIDAQCSAYKYGLASLLGSKRLRVYSDLYLLRISNKYVGKYITRTDYESAFLTKGLGIHKVTKVPLSYGIEAPKFINLNDKEPFCLHVSTFTQPRKNVMRLIDAAIKYQFKLVIAGDCGSIADFEPFRKKIDANENITWVGIVSDNELKDLYRRASVFSLPSTYEGVGMVALEAAVYGAKIVVTNMGGPKEYYDQFALTVNPYSIDEIGLAIVNSLNAGNDLQLQQFVVENYNISTNIVTLLEVYKELINENTKYHQ